MEQNQRSEIMNPDLSKMNFNTAFGANLPQRSSSIHKSIQNPLTMTMTMTMTMMSPTPPTVGGGCGGGRRRRCTTATSAIASLSLLVASSLSSSSFPPVANAFSVNSAAAAATTTTSTAPAFQHHNSLTTATRQLFLPNQYSGRRAAASAASADASKFLLHSLLRDNNDAYDSLDDTSFAKNVQRKPHNSITASLAIAIASTQLLFSPLSSPSSAAFAYNYDESDKYASETVTNVVTKLQSSAGDVDATFNTLEEVAKIITEGEGVGGTLTYGELRRRIGVRPSFGFWER